MTSCALAALRHPRARNSDDSRNPYNALRLPSRIAVAAPAAPLPPLLIVLTSANCEPPVNISTDSAHACSTENPPAAASAPNESP